VKFLLLNQTFYPDVASTAQHLADLARALAAAGHEVTVITGRRAYDNSTKSFPARETWGTVDIRRVWTTGFGKKAKWRRACDFLTFMSSCALRLLFARRPDVVIALTSPPLISFLGALFARMRGCRFVYWVMDLNPDEAIAAGVLKEGSRATRVFQWMSLFSFRNAAKSIVLDRFMQARVVFKGIDADNLVVMAPWSHDDSVRFDANAREQFRITHGLGNKFVVMYSGNHSPCHPLTTLLEAARSLAIDDRYVFCFVGGGSEFAKVQQFAASHALRNILCLPYQPLDVLAGSLSAADLHVVVMGDPFVGTIHPCKVYNILSVEAPWLYVGPKESHIGDIIGEMNTPSAVRVGHGDVNAAVSAIQAMAERGTRGDAIRYHRISERFSQKRIVPEMLAILESTVAQNEKKPVTREPPLAVRS
jgi:colanic acid biosynthesis glycosyl transferase WcaI